VGSHVDGLFLSRQITGEILLVLEVGRMEFGCVNLSRKLALLLYVGLVHERVLVKQLIIVLLVVVVDRVLEN
jgi:hypothetical protein